jgi:murein DD-endopeptidase MepM/ murein hydrolase activator NlpD
VTLTSRGANNREIVRVRHFVRVAGNLSLSMSELSAHIPPFNPQKMMLADAMPGAPAIDDAPDAETDAAVTFFTRDLAAILPRAKIAGALPIDDVIARVRDAANLTGAVATRAEGGSGIRMAYAAEGSIDPYLGLETRIVPENITLLPKTKPQATGGHDGTEKTITLRKGESLSTVLRDLSATPEEIRAIAALLGTRGRDGGMKEGQKLRVLLSPTADGRRLQPVRVVVASDTSVEAVVALSDLGRYVSVDVRSIDTEVAQAREEEEDDGKGIRLYRSITRPPRNQSRAPIKTSSASTLRRDFSAYSPAIVWSVRGRRRGRGNPGLCPRRSRTPAKQHSTALPATMASSTTMTRPARCEKFLVRKPLADVSDLELQPRNHPVLQYGCNGVDWAAETGTPDLAQGTESLRRSAGKAARQVIKIRTERLCHRLCHMSAFARI